jgi:hypothetical protein
MLIVFLNNKLVACDTIVPILHEVTRRRPKLKVQFVCFDHRTHEAIHKNIVLFDAMQKMGKLLYLGRRESAIVGQLQQRGTILYWLMLWIALAVCGRTTFLHFRALHQWPLAWFGRLVESRTVFFQASPFGETALELKVSNVIKTRDREITKVVGAALCRFTDDWPYHLDPRNAGRLQFKLDSPFSNGSWLTHLNTVADEYLATAFAEAGITPTREIVVCPIGWIADHAIFRGKNVLFQLLEEIVDITVEELPGLALFIKPHPAAVEQGDHIKKLIAARPGAKVVMTHLHPMLLASRARCAISFAHTRAFGSIQAAGVPTIEYTDYTDHVLAMTGGGSFRPDMVDHFINHDPAALRALLRSLPPRPPGLAPGRASSPLPEALVELLSGRWGGRSLQHVAARSSRVA